MPRGRIKGTTLDCEAKKLIAEKVRASWAEGGVRRSKAKEATPVSLEIEINAELITENVRLLAEIEQLKLKAAGLGMQITQFRAGKSDINFAEREVLDWLKMKGDRYMQQFLIDLRKDIAKMKGVK